ncbi:hypothetical protein KR222_000329 [Zaprionus bogoriensis]|nr:hypothetical protein KR222_000329 [Zaprionus bogoriensis]
MSLVIENEIKWLSEKILPETLRNGRLLDNYNESQAHTFHVGSIEIEFIGPEEAYMLTLCYRATVNFAYAGEKLQRKLIVKKTPKVSPELYASVQFGDLFGNEVGFYTDILPIILKQSDGKFAAPKYYYSEIKPNSALLILGDFGADGWSMAKDRYALSLEHARIGVKYLGDFHGFGFALKHSQRKLFDKLTSKLKDGRFSDLTMNHMWNIKQKTTLQRAGRAVAKYQPQLDKDLVRKFLHLTYSYKEFGVQRVAPREPFATLCHGDYLRNNVAYKYDTDNTGKPLAIMMFDYQTVRLSSPMIDLSVFLALSVFEDVRYQHFDILFDDYCNALIESYKKYSSEPLPKFLNRQDLLREYIKILPYAVAIASFFLMELVDPPTVSSEEMFNQAETDEETRMASEIRGGEVVDREIAHQIKEMLELSQRYNVSLDEDIDSTNWINEAKSFIE